MFASSSVRRIEHESPEFEAARDHLADVYRERTGRSADVVVSVQAHDLGTWVLVQTVPHDGSMDHSLALQAASDEMIPGCAVHAMGELAAFLAESATS